MLICRYDDLYGRFIIRLTWGRRKAYPQLVTASTLLWENWLIKESTMNELITTAAPDQIDPNAVLVTDEEFARLLATRPDAAERVDGQDVGFISTDDADETIEETQH